MQGRSNTKKRIIVNICELNSGAMQHKTTLGRTPTYEKIVF